MCGIFGCLSGRDSVPWLVEGLKALEYRGYDSAGVAVLTDGSIERRRVEGKIRDLEEYIKSHPVSGGCGLGHTRWATHGRPCENNAHPHVDCSGRIAIVHNGIIENFAGIKEALSREGHVFQSETDTEVIVHLIEKHFDGRLEDAVRAAAAELEGSFAVAAIAVADPGKIVIARNGPPAVLGLGSEGTFISSDITALLKHTDRVVFLDDGELAVITPKGVEYQAFDGSARRKKVETLSWTPARIEKRGFAHFMAKEIFEQPEVVRDALQSRVSLETGNVYLEGLKKVDEVLADVSRVIFISCGTSYHASLVGQYLLETLGGVSADVEYASEFRTRDFVVDPASLVVGVSQSGETADTLAALRTVKKMGRPVVAVSNNVSSTMARESDGVLDICAGPEIGVAATKTFIGQLTALTLFALYFAQRNHTLSPAESLALVQELQRIPHKMERILSRAGELERLAERLGPCQHYLYLGRWINFPVALEGALKLKEISYVHAEGYAGGEMKHGPIALIDEGLTTFALLPHDRVYQKMAGNIAEVKARNGRIVAVAYEGDRNAARMADTVITVPDVHELLSPLLTVLPLQLYAYYLASSKGLDVDQPRNLAKSVTVE